jgi:hypothetical protein
MSRAAASGLVDREALRGRELECLRQFGHDLGRPRLDQAGRVAPAPQNVVFVLTQQVP